MFKRIFVIFLLPLVLFGQDGWETVTSRKGFRSRRLGPVEVGSLLPIDPLATVGDTANPFVSGAFDKLLIDKAYVLSTFYNVKSPAYGATGDGSTDDSAALQAAVDSASAAGGGTVFIPEGVYITDGITLADSVNILGEGYSSILKLKASSDTAVIYIEAQNNILIADIKIDGNKGNQTGVSLGGEHWDGVSINDSNHDGTGTACNNIRVENVWVYQAPAHGIRCMGSNNVRIFNCTSEDCGDDGIAVEENSTHCIVSGCHLKDNQASAPVTGIGSGIEIEENTDDIIVDGNTCTGNVNGITLVVHTGADTLERCTVLGNTITGSTGKGISATGDLAGNFLYDCVIANNIISECADGIFVKAADMVSVVGNVIDSCYGGSSSGAIKFDNSVRFSVISNNMIVENQSPGISLANSNNNFNIISNNTVYKSTQAGISIANSNNLIEGNICIDNSVVGTSSGISLVAGADSCIVKNNICRDLGTQEYGIVIAADIIGLILDGNMLDGSSGAMLNLANGQMQKTTYCYDGWVTYAASTDTVTLGVLPVNAFVTNVYVYCYDNFDSDGADSLTVGYDGDSDAYATTISVSSSGVKAVTLGAKPRTIDGTERTVKAYYDDAGSDATQGRVHIMVEWITAFRVP